MSWWLGFGWGVICLAVALAVVGPRYVVVRRPTDRDIRDLIDDERVAGHLRADARTLRRVADRWFDKRARYPW